MMCLNHNARLAILDNMEKASSVAKSIADSNIDVENSWIGGRRIDHVWTWVDVGIGTGMKTVIPVDPNVENFPPWARAPTRPTKECLAIDRRSHNQPNFIDLDCRLPKPIICEKNTDEIMDEPVPSKWIRIKQSTYTLYYGKVTWHKAAAFCRAHGSRLAILKTLTVVNILANSMTKTRPDFETAWIGAHFSYGQWMWMATGSILNPLRDRTGYPPWRFGRPEKNDGCLLLDRHIEDSTSFLETSCDRKRNFVCEKYREDDDEDWLNEPLKFALGNDTFIIHPVDKTWSDSRLYCNERGSILAQVDNDDTLNVIVEAMGDHPREIHHVWLGGQFQSKTHAWHWIGNNKLIPKLKNSMGFPPWAHTSGLNYDSSSSSCLNLDRTDHVKPHFYGLDCASTQPFICKITCDIPPFVSHGSWKCSKSAEGQDCSLRCHEGLMVLGVRNVTCNSVRGWTTGLHWMEFPLCIEPTEYTARMIRSLSHDLQNSAGYYILIDHLAPVMQSLSLKFIEGLVNAFPVSRTLQLGMTSFTTVPPTYIPFNQTSTCDVLKSIHSLKKRINNATIDRKKDVSRFYHDIVAFNGRKILILAIIDSKRAPFYAETIDQLKSSGNLVTIIGLEEEWEMLLPLATVGLDRKKNLFLFHSLEMEKIIYKLDDLHQTPSKCSNRTAYDSIITIPALMIPVIPESTTTTTITFTDKMATNDSEESINRRFGYHSNIHDVPNKIGTTPSVQIENLNSGILEQKTLHSEKQLKISLVNSTNDTGRWSASTESYINNSSSDESIFKIYSEQSPRQNSKEKYIPLEDVTIRDLSDEATEIVQQREKFATSTSSKNGPEKYAPDTTLFTDGNEDTE